MLRKFIFRDTAAGRELVLPVTPMQYQIEHGRKANSITMYGAGAANLPGERVLLSEELECLLPAHNYHFNNYGAVTNPFVYIEQLERWSDNGTVLRFIISDTPVNAAVILDPIRYREDDGTNDITCIIPIRGYRQLALSAAESTGNGSRIIEGRPVTQTTYTIRRGDTLSAIARRFYGDMRLYSRLAVYNGIKNPNLIYTGQVLRLPPVASLPAAKAPGRAEQAVRSTKTAYSPKKKTWEIKIPRAVRIVV